MTFHDAMKRAREAQGLTQRELARLVGSEPNTINKIERGKINAGRCMRRRIADALGDPTCRRLAYGWSL